MARGPPGPKKPATTLNPPPPAANASPPSPSAAPVKKTRQGQVSPIQVAVPSLVICWRDVPQSSLNSNARASSSRPTPIPRFQNLRYHFTASPTARKKEPMPSSSLQFFCGTLCVLMTLFPASSPQSTDSSSAQKFATLSDQFMKDSLALSPVNASAAGYHTHIDPKTGQKIELDALLDDLSLESIASQRDFYASWRERFRAETPVSSLDQEDASDWQLIDDQIGLNLLEFDKIQNYRHNPTVVVELIGNALFLPLTQDYAPLDVRVGHVLSRVSHIPRLLAHVQPYLSDSDPVWISTAIEENAGNIDLIEHTLAAEIPAGSPRRAEYDAVAPPALKALHDFSAWLQNSLAKQPSNLTWRLGKVLYAQKFALVMETAVTPEEVLASAEQDMRSVRAEMLQIALPLHAQMYPDHNDHSTLARQ